MTSLTRVRAAIFTSAGLLPLACSGGRAADMAEATRSGDELDRPRSSSKEPQPNDIVASADGGVAGGGDYSLPGCGQDSAVHAEHMGIGVSQRSPVVTSGIATGIYQCESGLLHRPQPVTCQSHLPRPLPPTAGDAGAAPDVGEGAQPSQVAFLYPEISTSFVACSADTECTERPLGYCAPAFYGGVPSYNIECKYGCLSDRDCGPGYLCECGDPVGHCVQAECQSDEDCPGELMCAAWFTQKVCSGSQFYSCQSRDDECTTSADCADGFCSGEGGQRRCVANSLLSCGRPFLIQNEARVAGLLIDAEWSGCERSALENVSLLSVASRAVIGEYWARAALMEHASIAAFARFTLQLMHLGAPRTLIEASQQAMLDETNHAKACFSLAARYLETPVGPGPLRTAGALQDMDFEHIVLTAFHEGCVGETVAALEAREACEIATDAFVQRVLARVGTDELTHAELAWRFVRWALERGGPSVESALAVELVRLEAEAAQIRMMSDISPLSEHGLLSPGHRATVRRRALVEVVLPCGRELLANVRAQRSTPRTQPRRVIEHRRSREPSAPA